MIRMIDATELKTAFPSGEYVRTECVQATIDHMPTIDAIPVEWLKAQIRSYTGDVSDIGKSARNGTIKDLIRKWQKEQEAHDVRTQAAHD